MRWASAPLVIFAGLLVGVVGASAESGSFDMSTEHAPPPGAASSLKSQPRAPRSSPEPSPRSGIGGSNETVAAAERAILPFEIMRLNGEVDSRSWNVDLTRAESESLATLTITYKSAVVVAPESSRLRVLVNDRIALESPIASSEQMSRLSIRLPSGLLHSGPNLFRLEVSQRHRTDCSIASTYELWTDIYNSGSALNFESAAAATLRRVEDMNAVGVDEHGIAHLRIIAPALGQTALTRSILRFAQGAAILIGEPNETVAVSSRAASPGGLGVLTAVIGTANDLRSVLRSPPVDASTGPVAVFIEDPILGPSTLVISGPTTLAVSRAVDSIASLADDPLSGQRLSIATGHWFAPDAPMAFGAARFKFSELGARTQEFSGRRFTMQFMIGLPSDFYASAYGEATLLLDAAYSGEVLPGSHFDVFVNNQIAATAPITTSGGAILRHLPIRLLMTNFKPGPNLIRFEAQLNTFADQLCRTSGEANAASRFAIFDTSEFAMPDYARIARLPDLAALMGAGFPYSRSADPIALVMNEADADTVSAASTLLARVAVAGGRIIPFELASLSAVGGRGAIFVASADQMPGEVLSQLGIEPNLRVAWKAPPDDFGHENALPSPEAASRPMLSDSEFPARDELDTQATFSRWRGALSDGGGWRGNVSALQDWLQRTFQFSTASLRFLPIADVAFEAPRGSTVILAQGTNPSGDGAWTVLTAPSSKLLREGADALTAQKQWTQLAGHVVAYNGKTGDLSIQPVTTFSFFVTRPLSFGNLRLIIANWLSDNILTYSVLLLSTCILLGLVTALFLSRIGRGSA